MTWRRDRQGLARAFLAGSAALCLSCNHKAEAPLPEIEYSRCQAVYLPGPVCTLWEDRKLRLWMRVDPGVNVEVRAGSQNLTGEVKEVKGGRQYTLTIPEHASSLTAALSLPDGSRSASWSLSLAEPEILPWTSEIEKLETNGKTEQARRRLLELRTAAPREEQGLVLRSLAELARVDGDFDKAEAYLNQGIAADRAENCLSCEVEKIAWLAWLYWEQGRFNDLRRTLMGVRLPEEAPADAKYLMMYYQGLLSDGVGDYRSALEQLRKAADLAERVGRTDFRWKVEQVLARLLQDLGRSQEAAELFARLRADPHPEAPCDIGILLMNCAWSMLLAREGGEKAADPSPILEEAQAEFDKNPCSPAQRLNARLNLALARQQAGRWQEARQILAQARPLASFANLHLRLWWHDLEGRAALAEGHPERALRLYEELEEMAARALSYEGRFRASLGRAHALLALGRRTEAVAALAQADALIDKQIWRVPAHEGRDTLIAQREVATRLYLELLLEEGEPRKAFNLARRARSRLLRQLTLRDRLAQLTPKEQDRWIQALSKYLALRDDIDRRTAEEWQLPGDQKKHAREGRASQLAQALADLDRAMASFGDPGARGEPSLPPPRPGEVVLIYHPLPQGWVGFAAHAQGIEVNTFELPDAALTDRQLSQILLEPFRSALEQAERVRILPYGRRLRQIDFHALPFGKEPLLALRPVVYGLDLPHRPLPGPSGRRRALLVADPGGDLPAAQQEAATIAAVAGTWKPGWNLKRLDGTAARAEAVRAALPEADLFHYAGHGTFAGFAGWASVLTLADGSPLTVGDLLALPQAPAWVVLSSCDAGRSSEQAPGEGIGLAHAFILAGSQHVIAATRRVPDRTARDLVRELYRGWQPGADLPRQFQRAQRACSYSHPASDCASFRLLEP